jgi:hypothetical protein
MSGGREGGREGGEEMGAFVCLTGHACYRKRGVEEGGRKGGRENKEGNISAKREEMEKDRRLEWAVSWVEEESECVRVHAVTGYFQEADSHPQTDTEHKLPY